MDKSTNSKITSSDNRGERTLVRLSLTSMLTLLFLGVAAIALAYIGGVMSGRHSCPVPQIPKNSPVAEQNGTTRPDSKILAASELNFARALRGENNQVEKLGQPAEEKVPSTDKRAASPENPENARAASEKIETNEKTKSKTDKAAKADTAQIAHKEKNADTGMYDHVFQVGAFRDENSVDKLRQTLEGHGLRTAMQKEGNIFIVLVRLRGTLERAAEVAQLAQSLGLGAPVQRSRSPVRE